MPRQVLPLPTMTPVNPRLARLRTVKEIEEEEYHKGGRDPKTWSDARPREQAADSHRDGKGDHWTSPES